MRALYANSVRSKSRLLFVVATTLIAGAAFLSYALSTTEARANGNGAPVLTSFTAEEIGNDTYLVSGTVSASEGFSGMNFKIGGLLDEEGGVDEVSGTFSGTYTMSPGTGDWIDAQVEDRFGMLSNVLEVEF